MKIVHVCTGNIKLFVDALEDTECKVNGSSDATYMQSAILNFNARDTMGLVVFRPHITKRILALVNAFDNLMYFHPLPIVLICDDAKELYEQRRIRVRNCPLFCVNSVDGTISDVDIRKIITTLSLFSGEIYELKAVENAHKQRVNCDNSSKTEHAVNVSNELLLELAELERQVKYETEYQDRGKRN